MRAPRVGRDPGPGAADPPKPDTPRERRSGRLRVVTTGSSLLEPGVCVCVCECVSMHTCAHLCLGVGRGELGVRKAKRHNVRVTKNFAKFSNMAAASQGASGQIYTRQPRASQPLP